jgi:anti-sigma regulatory factor (Ser/Thr protein kinase)
VEARSNEDVFRVASETDRFWCASEVRRYARNLGFGERAQWELAIVAAELVSNAVRYGGSGMLKLRTTSGPRAGMEIVVADSGSGPAATAGSAPAATPSAARTGLGLGLRTVRCLCHEVSIERDYQGGIVVTAARYLES